MSSRGRELVARQAQAVAEVLTRALRDDGSAAVHAEHLDPILADLASVVEAVIGATRDARAERDRALAELRRSTRATEAIEARTRATLDGVFDAVLTARPDGRIAGCNRAAEQLFGLPEREALGRDVRAVTGCGVGGAEAGIRVVEARASGGRTFPAELAVSSVDVGDERMLVCVFREVSEHLAFERRIQESLATLAEEKGRLEAILAATSDGMVLLDRSGRVVFANRGFGDMLGFTSAALTGLTADDLLERLDARRPTPPDAFARVLGDVTSTRTVEPLRCDVRRPGRRTLQLAARPVTSEDGALHGRIAIFRDVTAEEQARRAKDDLVGNVSHELRTPLTSIRGFVDLIRNARAGPITSRQKDFLGIVAENVARLEALVSDLLDVDRLETAPLSAEPVPLAPLLREVIAAQEPAATQKGLSLSIETPETLAAIGDPARLRQVFANLVSNAVKYTPTGGVRVRGRSAAAGRVSVEVEDTGIGISESDRSRLFERFFRAGHAYVREVGGTGLGLSIVKTLVERQGGRIDVESEPGRGSTFRVLLPAPAMSSAGGLLPAGGSRSPREAASSASRAAPASPGAVARPLRPAQPPARHAATDRIDFRAEEWDEEGADLCQSRILVIEDDEEALRVCRAALGPTATVLEARSRDEALPLLTGRRPNLVILAATVGGADGWGLLSELRRRGGIPRVPVLLLGSPDASARALRAGAEGFLLKPLEELSLRSEVTRALARGSVLDDPGGPP